MKNVLFFIFLIFMGCNKVQIEEKVKEDNVSFSSINIAYNGSNRGAAYLVTNKLVVNKEHVYCVYLQYDYSIAIVDYNIKTNQVSDPVIIGESVDNHGNPSILMDEQGYIYVAYGGHSLDYSIARSNRPFDISEWHSQTFSFKSKKNVVRSPAYTDLHSYKGKLYLLCRASSYSEGTILTLIEHNAENLSYIDYTDIFIGYAKSWELEGREVFEKNLYNRQYNFFRPNMVIDKKGCIHIAFQVYEYMPIDFPYKVDPSGGKYYFIGYLRSDDLGKSWITHTGRKITSLPCKPDDVDPVVGFGNPYQAVNDYETSNMIICNGSPYLLYHVYKDKSELYLAKIGDEIVTRKIDFKKNPIEDVECNSESSFMIDKYGNYIYVLSLVNKEDYKSYNGFGKPSTKLRILVNDKIVTDIDDGMNWFPNLGRFSNDSLYFLYQKGSDAAGCQIKLGKIVSDEIFFNKN